MKKKRKMLRLALPLLILGCAAAVPASPVESARPIDIGSRLELFVDRFLIEKMDGTRLQLHEPVPAGIAVTFDRPWEGSFSAYVTVLKDGGTYRMYYRGIPEAGGDSSNLEVTCYAESVNGKTWVKPDLGFHEVRGTRKNNVILANISPFTANFSPFLDANPAAPAAERFKALAGNSVSGLVPFVSADGIRWQKKGTRPVLTDGAFDSQNVSFWSEAEQCYLCYFRTWSEGGYNGFRTVSRARSTDFLVWSKREPMDFGDTPMEHLYTNQTTPYFRAPHILLALPMRFMPGRKVLSEEQALALGVSPNYKGDCADAVFMSSRGGSRYDRTFMEAFIRPGTDVGNWASRAGLSALGIVPTGEAEISLYKQAHYAQPSARLDRYTLRTDGFVSVNAPFAGGEFSTRLLAFTGKAMIVNCSTSAAGSVRVQIEDDAGAPVPGYSLADSDEIVGDSIERIVRWKAGSDVSALAGKPVRLRFAMKDADLYSIRFRD
jgi:hypothetical protein